MVLYTSLYRTSLLSPSKETNHLIPAPLECYSGTAPGGRVEACMLYANPV